MKPIRRRQLLGVLGSAATIGLAGCLGTTGSSGESANTSSRGSTVEGPVANAPLPKNPSAYTYATMGRENRPTVTYYGSWKCRYCAQFSTGFLKEIVTDYVESGTVSLTFRALAYINGQPFLGPDAPRATRAGLAVWNVDPETYWEYHEYVFANQPPESKQWATTEQLITFAKRLVLAMWAKLRRKLLAVNTSP